MESAKPLPPEMRAKAARLLLAAVVAALGVCAAYSALLQRRAAAGHPELPFGVTYDAPGGVYLLNDFATHFHFCRAIWNRVHPRPYTPEGQEAMFRSWSEAIRAGMPFAYSPSLVALARPFVGWPPAAAFACFSLLQAVLLAAFVWKYVPPRLGDRWQLAQAVAALGSLSLLSTFWIGQTSIVSTVLLAAAWALLTVAERRSLLQEGLLGILLWMLSSKPSIGILLGFWLLAFRAWRALGMGALLCGLSCLWTAPLLGGWPLWISDYLHLLGNYHQDGIGAFMAPGLPPRILTNLFGFLVQSTPLSDAAAAGLCRDLWLAGLAALTGLAALRRIRPPHFLQLSLVWFLVFCPHVSATEDWALVLAVLADGRPQRPARGLWILLLVLAAVNLRQGIGSEHLALALGAKIALLATWAADAIQLQRRQREGLADDVAAGG